jgi:hypothetical protein
MGEKRPERQICKALKKFFPEFEGKQQNEVLSRLGKALIVLQKIVRLVIRAYIHIVLNQTRDEWPNENEFDDLPLNPKKCRIIQKQLGIKPYITNEMYKIRYWQSADRWQVSGKILKLER